jgi:hypothetical protein
MKTGPAHQHMFQPVNGYIDEFIDTRENELNVNSDSKMKFVGETPGIAQ